MSSYSYLKQISIAYAMQAMADLAVPSGTKDKVLQIPVSITASNFDKRKDYSKNFTVIVYRPMNYCFVGMIEGTPWELVEGQDVHFESYHDSCWRDGIDRMIKKEANEIYSEAEKDETDRELNIFNSFGTPKVIDGIIVMNDNERTAKFTKKI